MVLDKLPVPGRPATLDNGRVRAYCAVSRCEWVCFDTFLSSFISLFFLPLSGRRLVGWLVGWLSWANGPLRQYFSLYRTVS